MGTRTGILRVNLGQGTGTVYNEWICVATIDRCTTT